MNIYHYTDLNGFKGIIEGDSLWATNIHFMNDKNEFRHGCLCFKNTIDYLGEDVIPEIRKRMLKNAISMYDNVNLMSSEKSKHIYSISFCRKSDQLSQWRGYGSSQGISIEFSESELVDGIKDDSLGYKYGDVIYTEEDSTVEVNERIVDFFENISPHFKIKAKEDDPKVVDAFMNFIAATHLIDANIPFFKNAGFREEDEFRIVFTRKLMMPKVNFRVGAYGLTPYLNVKMQDDGKLPIKRVIIGPAKDKELISMGVRMLLDANKYSNVSIEFSNVPYRG